MGTKYRGLAGLLVLFGLGAFMSCGGSGAAAPNPGVTGTGYVFVATQGDQKIVPFTIDLSSSKVSSNGTGLATGNLPSAAAITPDGNSIFVANSNSGDISRYTVKSDGTLTAVTPTQTTGGMNPVSMAMDAAGKFLLVLNQGNPFPAPPAAPIASTVSVFSIGSGAALTLKTTTTVTIVGGNPPDSYDSLAVAITPDAKYVYVANRTNGTVTGYSMDGGGNLTLVPGSPFAAGTGPAGLVVTPDSATSPSSDPIFLYVANSGSNNISVFAVCDKVSISCPVPDGTLTEITGSPFGAGTEPGSMVIVNPAVTTPPSGTFLYAVDKGSNQLSAYVVGKVSGALTAASPPNSSTGANPVWAAAKPNGQYVYVANNGGSSFSVFTITDTSLGTLAVTGTPTATGTGPAAIVVK